MIRDNKYVLDEEGLPRVAYDFREWAEWFEHSGERRRVAFHHLGTCSVSTVFLGLDHNFSGVGPPLLFKTMVFDLGREERFCRRCPTREMAEQMHALAVRTMGRSVPWWLRLVGMARTLWWRLHQYEWDFASSRWRLA